MSIYGKNALDRRRRARDQGGGTGPDDVQLGKQALGLGGDDEVAQSVGDLQAHLNDSISDPGRLEQAHRLLEAVLAACNAGGEDAIDPDMDDRAPRESNAMARDRRMQAVGQGLDKYFVATDERSEARRAARYERSASAELHRLLAGAPRPRVL